MFRKNLVLGVATAILCLPTLALTQPVPFLSEEEYSYLVSDSTGSLPQRGGVQLPR
jgi:hypothetical protein